MDVRIGGLRCWGQAAAWGLVMLALAWGGIAQAAETTTYVLTDDQGTVLMLTDNHGNPVARLDHRPYGRQQSGPVNAGPGYTGHVEDPDTGLVYMQQRYYDPEVGRFLSVDPVTAGRQHFNRYWYANNNPIRYIDPDGRETGVALQSINKGVKYPQVPAQTASEKVIAGGAVALVAVPIVALVAPEAAGGVGVGGILVRQGGKEVVSRLVKGAVKDDVKGGVRQIIKSGGEKQMNKEYARAVRGATEGKPVQTAKGLVRNAEHSDGTKVSARTFSNDGRPTIQVKDPQSDAVLKVRYDQ